MKRAKRPLLTRIIERIPQTITLGSGITIGLRGHHDYHKFLDIFTSREYLCLVHNLSHFNSNSMNVIDCGAGIGLFSLLLEHLCRLDILPWKRTFYTLIEPSRANFAQLGRNLRENLPNGSYNLIMGLVGQMSGDHEFYESREQPWRSSIFKEKKLRGMVLVTRVPFVSLAPLLVERPCLVKLDIEGAEFMLLESLSEHLHYVDILIIEWHTEFGNIAEGEKALINRGFNRVKRNIPCEGRIIDLFMTNRLACPVFHP